MSQSKFKTKWEYEQEDMRSYQRRLDKIQRKREMRRAEGFKCKFEECEAQFESQLEFDQHIKKHREECKKAMKCTKPQCKDVQVKIPLKFWVYLLIELILSMMEIL